MDRKVLLGSVCAFAMAAVSGVGGNTAHAQVTEIFGGGATLPATVLRRAFNCYGENIDNIDAACTNEPTFACGGGITSRDDVWIGYASVGSTRGREGFIAEDSRALARTQRPSEGVVVPYSSTAGSCIDEAAALEQDRNGNNTIPAATFGAPGTVPTGILVFDDNRDEFEPDFNSPASALRPVGQGWDPSPGPNPNTFWTLHYTTSEAPIPQTNPGDEQQSYDCYEGDATAQAAVANTQFSRSCLRDKRVTNGQPLQLPLLAVGVTIAYNDSVTEGTLGRPDVDRANEDFDVASRLNISEAAACGIFTGAIDTWDNPAISNSFGNPVLPSEDMLVVVRGDGSGTSFVFSSWLDRVCDGVRGRLFTDPSIGGEEGPAPSGGQSDNPNWLLGVGIYEVSGNEGVAGIIASTDFAVGYITPGLTDIATDTLRIGAGGFEATEIGDNGPLPDTLTATPDALVDSPIAAAVANREGRFRIPETARVRSAIADTTEPPRCNTQTVAGDVLVLAGEPCLEPEIWGDLFTDGDENNPGSIDPAGNAAYYPINGFNWLNLYECYRFPEVALEIDTFLQAYYRTDVTEYAIVLEEEGFAPLPSDWLGAVRTLIRANNTRPGGVGSNSLNNDCIGLEGAGRGFRPTN